ncbi:general secretion pathway protein GspG [Burkholderia territorii]|uniref:type II secretion system protein n=1 Tax=Burkholderia territorii TaxID=1503055 RepID=UPI00075DB0A6|nr:prepilin-type N-terminal cleavage/methylation domain-containing protein [Burkholderia territorii]KVG56833.1 general secretion pathway protein GspG [Burkholderia territorii]KVT83109.1 general secretion pathway protein GspG [Burkholderia territorii]KWH02346.1 general secretion pathway protein GspG [Burkholderia territorii]
MKSARIGSIRGFTLIEIVVVMAIVGLLLTLAVPRYMHSIEHGKEQVRRQNLAVMRNAIDQYYGDNGQYPETLDELVAKHYLRAVPVDPVNGDDKWATLASPDETKPGVYDVAPASSAQGVSPGIVATDAPGAPK